LQVLDAETGIGYIERTGSNLSPLLENLVVPAKNERDSYDIKWNKTEQWLFDQLKKDTTARELVIEEKDIADFAADFSRYPPSLSVLFSMLEDGTTLFKGCSGSSAANLLGRFAHADETINELVLKITTQEQQLNEEVVLAEIIHLPEDRVGNILLHPAFREYEIPFLAQSSVPYEKQVQLQDILVSVGQDKHIRLFSKKLNREIIPRLSNAHNYSVASLPVYHFLAELQTQGLKGGLAFGWGSMSRHFNYLPRVRSGNVILFEATWQLQKIHFEKLVTANPLSAEIMREFKNKWQLPVLFVLADGDNELLVDWESRESVETFIKTIKGREAIQLKEFLRPGHDAVTDEEQRPYNNQFVAVLMNEQKVYTSRQPLVIAEDKTDNTERKFLPGSEWLYYKIYCGSKTADEILLSCIRPLTEELLSSSLIDKWFYIRYNDPDFHLRVRFHVSGTHNTGKVIESFLHYIGVMDKEGLIWKLQMDTYQREMERYGNALIVPAEDLFFADSKMKLEFLSLTEGDEREKLRWLWALRGTDELLTDFNYTLAEKYELLQLLKEIFAREFNADKMLYRQLNQQYTDNRALIQQVMENPVSPANPVKPLIEIYTVYREEMGKAAMQIISSTGNEEKKTGLNNLLGSYIHMSLNRLFLSEPRLHEMVIYDLLCSWYRGLIKRNPGTAGQE
jgi:thiopeptide-type bacteriocin biosynthesis protein